MDKIKLFIVFAILDERDGGEIWNDIIDIFTDEQKAIDTVNEINAGTYEFQKELPLWNRVDYITRHTDTPKEWKPFRA